MVKSVKYVDDIEKWCFVPELIEIYKRSPEEKFERKVPTMPHCSYRNIIDAMEELVDDIKRLGREKPSILEQVMIKWLLDVAPEKVNRNNIKAIHEFACAIGDRVSQKSRLEYPKVEVSPLPLHELLAKISEVIAFNAKKIKKGLAAKRLKTTAARLKESVATVGSKVAAVGSKVASKVASVASKAASVASKTASVGSKRLKETAISDGSTRLKESVASTGSKRKKESVGSVGSKQLKEPVTSVGSQRLKEPVTSVASQRLKEPVTSVGSQRKKESIVAFAVAKPHKDESAGTFGSERLISTVESKRKPSVDKTINKGSKKPRPPKDAKRQDKPPSGKASKQPSRLKPPPLNIL